MVIFQSYVAVCQRVFVVETGFWMQQIEQVIDRLFQTEIQHLPDPAN